MFSLSPKKCFSLISNWKLMSFCLYYFYTQITLYDLYDGPSITTDVMAGVRSGTHVDRSISNTQVRVPIVWLSALVFDQQTWQWWVVQNLFFSVEMPRSFPTSIDEVTTVVIISGINFRNFNSQKSNMVADIKTISAQWDCQWYSDISRAKLPKLTYFDV